MDGQRIVALSSADKIRRLKGGVAIRKKTSAGHGLNPETDTENEVGTPPGDTRSREK